MSVIWVGSGRFNAYIGPVQDYIDRVVAADVAAGNTLGLEVGVRDSYDVFIRDSINAGDLGTSAGVLSQANSIIKAAPILAGAQTIPGALTPLVGPAPTNVNFGSEDYNRKLGLKGNGAGGGSTKRLDTNRNNTADPQNSRHACVWVSEAGSYSLNMRLIAAGDTASNGDTNLTTPSGPTNGGWLGGSMNGTCASTPNQTFSSNAQLGFFGINRSASAFFTFRNNANLSTIAQSSSSPQSKTYGVFAFAGDGSQQYFGGRIAFYSIGESLDMDLFQGRLSTLMTAIAAAF